MNQLIAQIALSMGPTASWQASPEFVYWDLFSSRAFTRLRNLPWSRSRPGHQPD